MADAEATRYLAAMRIWPVPTPAAGRLEGQARDRAAARGFVDISQMKRDDAGIWRGTAHMDGKEFSLAVDFKGNVVASPR